MLGLSKKVILDKDMTELNGYLRRTSQTGSMYTLESRPRGGQCQEACLVRLSQREAGAAQEEAQGGQRGCCQGQSGEQGEAV